MPKSQERANASVTMLVFLWRGIKPPSHRMDRRFYGSLGEGAESQEQE